MKPFWHPLSAVLLADPPMLVPPGAVRALLARGPVEVLYAGDRMRPAARHGQRIVVERLDDAPPRAGIMVLAAPDGILDLARVFRLAPPKVALGFDADPAQETIVDAGDLLGRARLPVARPGRLSRTARRMAFDLEEALNGRPDSEDDPAASVKAKYDFQAPFYSGVEGPDLPPALLARVRREAAPGGRILVAGSGTGRECFALAREGWQVRGVDFAPAMVEAARRQAERRGLAVEFLLSDLRRHGTEEDGSLAAVLFTYDVYSFVPSREERVAMLRRMLGWLAPGGALLLSARRVRSTWDLLCLSVQRIARGRGGAPWGASHARWLATDGSLRRSFVQAFTDRGIRREVDEAGGTIENWDAGHAVVRPRSRGERA